MESKRTYDLLLPFWEELSSNISDEDLKELALCVDECIDGLNDLVEIKATIASAKSAEDIASELPILAIELAHIYWHIRQAKFLKENLEAFDD